MKRNGFTLIEMIVALVIFALIATAGVALLRASADTQLAVEDGLTEQAAIERLSLLINADLSQAALRPTRRADGGFRPAFVGTSDNMIFVRDGIVSTESKPSPSLHRVEWAVREGRLERTGHRQPDGVTLEDPAAILLRDMRAARFEYRDAAGGWISTWPDGSGRALPRAVRLTVTGADWPETTLVVALPDIEPPAVSAADEDA
ncbi:type II secretion system minor pseudopilin GspJ [Sphingomicrobium nitratireducens]|uniref:type II secretion system minor pseudopilin GspJ n=1 Tax=Sphingomicrobium nitratireducens TaxID=2964666 RepID=UPI00223F3781